MESLNEQYQINLICCKDPKRGHGTNIYELPITWCDACGASAVLSPILKDTQR